MVRSCMLSFHFERGCLYYAHFSIHFPLFLALYVERVIAYEQWPSHEVESMPFEDLLCRELPLEVLQDLEVDCYYGFVASFSGLKVGHMLFLSSLSFPMGVLLMGGKGPRRLFRE